MGEALECGGAATSEPHLALPLSPTMGRGGAIRKSRRRGGRFEAGAEFGRCNLHRLVVALSFVPGLILKTNPKDV